MIETTSTFQKFKSFIHNETAMQYEILKFTLLWKHGEPPTAWGWFVKASHRSRHSYVFWRIMVWQTWRDALLMSLYKKGLLAQLADSLEVWLADSFQLLASGSISALEQRSDSSWDNDWARWWYKGLALSGQYSPLTANFVLEFSLGWWRLIRSA